MKCYLIGAILTVVVTIIDSPAIACLQFSSFYHTDYKITKLQESIKIPQPVAEGLELYKVGKVEAAVNKWIGSIIAFFNAIPATTAEQAQKKEENIRFFKQSMPTMVNFLNMYVGTMTSGEYQSHSVIKSDSPTADLQRVYLEVRHKKGSIFMRFYVIKLCNEWMIHNVTISADKQEILK